MQVVGRLSARVLLFDRLGNQDVRPELAGLDVLADSTEDGIAPRFRDAGQEHLGKLLASSL